MTKTAPKHIFLVGLPGSGKSKYGKKLAKYLKWEYLDSDTEIEKLEQRSVIRIFEESGEEYFRKLERAFVDSIPSNKHYVISTGGGMPCYNNLIQIIKEKGITIYLQIPPEIIASRIQTDNTRPMFLNLESSTILQRLKDLLIQREPFYIQADKVIVFDKNDMWKKIKCIIDEMANINKK